MIMESSEIVSLLRQEMSGYGSLLALFDEQQGHLWRRDVDKVLHTAAIIDQQVLEAGQYREARETWLVAFARSHAQPGGSTLRQLLPFSRLMSVRCSKPLLMRSTTSSTAYAGARVRIMPSWKKC